MSAPMVLIIMMHRKRFNFPRAILTIFLTVYVAVLYQNFTLHEISNKRYYFCFFAAKHVIAIFNLIHLCSAVLRFEQLNSIFDWYNGVLTLVLITDNTKNRKNPRLFRAGSVSNYLASGMGASR